MKQHKEPDKDERKGYKESEKDGRKGMYNDHDADDRGKKAPHMKPEGKRGMAQVERIGRTYKTGGFKKIEESAAKEYGSKKAGEKVAGAVFNKMAAKHGK